LFFLATILSAHGAEPTDRVSWFTNFNQPIPGQSVAIDFVAIPGGQIEIGSPLGEPGREPHEACPRIIQVKPFWLGKYEVTWRQYLPFMSVEPSQMTNKQPSYRAWVDQDGISHPSVNYAIMDRTHGHQHYPVTGVGWIAASEYCRWLRKKTGRPFRLPSEEEWEYACRAGSTNAYFWGNDTARISDYGWFLGNSADVDSAETPHPVGLLKPNRFGLFDMAGNMAEWCGKTSPDSPAVLRGGAFCSPPSCLRSAARWIEHPDWDSLDPEIPRSPWWLTVDFAGFRIALDAEAP